jgi:hypothetical protein
MEDRAAGWLGLAWVTLLIVGVWNIIQGIFAFFRSSFWTQTGAHYVLGDLRTWAWVLIIWGALLLLAAFSVMSGHQFGRWFGIFAAALGVIVQMMFLYAAPFWALITIGLYILVIFGLVVYGAKEESA